MTVDDVMGWLSSLGVPEGASWTMGRLDQSRERRVGVYQRPRRDGMEVAIGGPATTLTRTKSVQLLVHWTGDADETERAAQALYDAIAASGHPTVGGAAASYIDLVTPEPVDLGADSRGTFERAIWLDIYYQTGE